MASQCVFYMYVFVHKISCRGIWLWASGFPNGSQQLDRGSSSGGGSLPVRLQYAVWRWEASVREERDEMQVHEEEILMVARVRGEAMAASGN